MKRIEKKRSFLQKRLYQAKQQKQAQCLIMAASL